MQRTNVYILSCISRRVIVLQTSLKLERTTELAHLKKELAVPVSNSSRRRKCKLHHARVLPHPHVGLEETPTPHDQLIQSSTLPDPTTRAGRCRVQRTGADFDPIGTTLSTSDPRIGSSGGQTRACPQDIYLLQQTYPLEFSAQRSDA